MIETLKQALAYIDGTLKTDHLTGYDRKQWVMRNLRAAIDQLGNQEPVAWTDENFMRIYVSQDIAEDMGADVPLYSEERVMYADLHGSYEAALPVEGKLREKNGGQKIEVWGISPPVRGEDGRAYAYTNETDWAMSLREKGFEVRPLVYADTTPPAQPAVPEGWKLVPVEPTECMQEAGMSEIPTENCHPYDAGMVYKAMLAAAPEKGGQE